MTTATATDECRIDDCPNPRSHHKTLCAMHRWRIRKHGDPDFTQWTVADDLDVELAAADRRLLPGMTRLERRLLALRLSALEVSAAEIARVVDVTPRTVHRWRSALRLVPAPATRKASR